jgi:superfamily I DNA/RNA helicase
MMTTGDAGAGEAARQRELADEHARRAGIARQMARSFEEAAHSEQRLARTLIELEPLGYTLLADRKRPGSASGNVDLVLVGPGGVILIDAKAWASATIADGRVWRGDEDATGEIERLADLVHLTQAELAEVGLAPGEVRAMVAFTGLDVPHTELFGLTLLGDAAAVIEIARLGARLSPTRVAEVRVALDLLFPPGTTGPVEIPVAPIPDSALPLDAATPTAEEIYGALLDGLEQPPIEDWMAFLVPEQARLVRRSFAGPSRIRGAAGTGKTVVALHRAAYLARVTGGPVLVTSFVSSLPGVLASLLRRMAPDVVDRVEFRSVHRFAAEVLAERDAEIDVDAELASRIFDEVWHRHGLGGVLGAIDPGPRYWYEEVSAVLKGRGITQFSEYAGLARHGRQRELTVDQRVAVWELFVAYEAELRSRGVADWQDLILEADAALREEPLVRYRAVIVDEAQDLSPVMIRMLHSLVGDIPDGLILVGDGQQTIYPGGATLAEAGVSIAGRSAVLTTNHRNTAEIAAFARLVVRDDQHPDLEGGPVAGGSAEADEARAPRRGARPVYTVFPSRAVHDRSLVERVRRIVADAEEAGRDVRLGDIGVLALYAWHAKEAAEALGEAGIPTIDLARYDGSPRDAVRVGTIKRAKGLEFAEVLVVRTPPHLVQGGTAVVEDAAVERATLQRRELFVGMTRARDGLWVGVA